MMGKEVYKIRDDYGRLYLKAVTGEYAGIEELEDVIARLQKTRDEMLAGAAQRDLLRADLEQIAQNVASRMRVEYPFNHPFAVHRYGVARRSPKQPRFHGVYVLTVAERPHTVKIGLTIDLYNRTKGLYHDLKYELGDPHILPVAFIHTDELEETERILHDMFTDARIEKEWFHREPVEDWLKQFRSAS